MLKKSNQAWIWIALCRKTRQIVACVIGDRSEATCRKVWRAIPQVYRTGTCSSDFWAAYAAVIPESQHTAVGKGTGEAARGKQSRAQIYIQSSQSSLPAPISIRLAHLGLAKDWANVTASDNGLYYRGKFYKPEAQDKESTYCWLNAASSMRKVPLYILPSVEGDDADKDNLIIACLDGKTWEEVIPVKSQRPSAKKNVENQRSSVKRKKKELGVIYDEMKAILAKKYISKRQVHALTGAPIIHKRDAEDQNDPVLGPPAAGDADTPLDTTIDAGDEKAPRRLTTSL